MNRAGGVVLGSIQGGEENTDKGPAVEFYESPNLDRFVRRARQFLDEQRYADAIHVLQAVVEGRTLEAESIVPPEPPPAPPEPSAATDAPPKDGSPGLVVKPPVAQTDEIDPKQAVFSVDGRIYRPAGRLCQEYLATMPQSGIELYQAIHETAASEALAEALDHGTDHDLERVVARWFPTLAAGQALQRLADRHMHAGHYRAAVQTLRDLVELYPSANLSRLGISVLWCRFKIAMCMRLAGEVGAAHDAAVALATAFPDESLRLMGELQPVRDLPSHPLFQMTGRREDRGLANERDALQWLDASTETLVPLWKHVFAGTNPYAVVPPKRDGNSGFFFGSNTAISTAPWASRYGVGTQIAFRGSGSAPFGILFLENYRLRVADAFTGVMQVEGDGEDVPVKPQENRPRPRVPAYDFALATPVEDEDRVYAVLGYNRVTQSLDALKKNEIVAYRKPACERIWTTQDWFDGEDGLAEVTFLAAPTVFGERLLTPILRNGAYELQCLDRRTGKPLWRTRIHAGGSRFYKAPGAQVKVLGNVAFVLTNAGAVAAIDAFAGDLRWTRKYEREDPLRTRPARRRSDGENQFGYGYAFHESDLQTFLPSQLLVDGGTLIFAGCDSDMLTCLDTSNGEVVWMLDGTSRYAPYGMLSHLIAMDANCLYAEARGDLRNQIVCIEKATGILRWAQEIPRMSDRLTNWPGRGCLAGNFLVLPGDRELLVLEVSGKEPWRHLPLPALGAGDEPLAGPANLFSSGPWIAVCYATGIEFYSTAPALLALATASKDPLERASLLVQSGRKAEAIEELITAMANGNTPPDQLERCVLQALDFARELGIEAESEPVAALDRVQPFAVGKPLQLAFRLARMDVFRARSDTTALEAEQQILYRLMEGKQ